MGVCYHGEPSVKAVTVETSLLYGYVCSSFLTVPWIKQQLNWLKPAASILMLVAQRI